MCITVERMFHPLKRTYFLITLLFAATLLIAYHSYWNPSYSLNMTLPHYGFTSSTQQRAVQDLFKKAGIIGIDQSWEEVFPIRDNALALAQDLLQMVQVTQQKFTLRQHGQERWEVKPLDWMKKNKTTILQDLRTLGFVEEVSLQTNKADALCILGATRPRMTERVAYAETLIQQGFQTNRIILLTGERYVTQKVDGAVKTLSQIATRLRIQNWHQLTETHLLQDIYTHSTLQSKNFTLDTLDVPANNASRPTTQSTLLALIQWLQAHPEIHHIVFVSNQPYLKYQGAIIDTLFSAHKINISYEVVGPAVASVNKLQPLLEGFGSYLWAATPAVLSTLQIDPTTPELKATFDALYPSSLNH